jgi:NADP-dependent 3-hydroxy acid dehydrogenase YdfG
VVTGASSGIGAATARALAREGFHVVVGARRLDRLEEVAREVEGVALQLDVTEPASIERFAAALEERFGRCDVLVNNAGLALGLSPVAETPDEDWVGMLDVNVLGLLRVTRAMIPLLRRAPTGHIVNLGSIAGFEVYRGGAGYTATKHAVRAISRTLRIELNGEPIRVTEIAPGMVETEFSLVRFRGDDEKARNVYEGLKPLTGEDVAECIAFAVTRPAHVDIDEIVIRPLAQANSFVVHREQQR